MKLLSKSNKQHKLEGFKNNNNKEIKEEAPYLKSKKTELKSLLTKNYLVYMKLQA